MHRKHGHWLMLFSVSLAFLTDASMSAWSETLSLPALVQKTMAFYFESTAHPGISPTSYQSFLQHLPPISSPYHRPAGVFVTLSHNGTARACWGSAFPQQKNVTESIVYATLGALTKEYRYKPIQPNEWRQLKPQVTVIKALEPIHGLQGQNPMQDGLMVRQGGRTGVILPGEARDATYQLMLCKLKAGLQPGQKFQLYRMTADVYH